jgi:hypothetical protein
MVVMMLQSRESGGGQDRSKTKQVQQKPRGTFVVSFETEAWKI